MQLRPGFSRKFSPDKSSPELRAPSPQADQSSTPEPNHVAPSPMLSPTTVEPYQPQQKPERWHNQNPPIFPPVSHPQAPNRPYKNRHYRQELEAPGPCNSY